MVAWLSAQSALDLFISVLTIGEVTMGVELPAPGKRREELQTWVASELPRRFVGRLLSIDDAVAREWDTMSAQARTSGRELPTIDGLLLATARVHGLTLVTRNEADCADRGVRLHNPWK